MSGASLSSGGAGPDPSPNKYTKMCHRGAALGRFPSTVVLGVVGGLGNVQDCLVVPLAGGTRRRSLHVVDVGGAWVCPERGFHRTLSGERAPPACVHMALGLTGPMYSWLPRAQIQGPQGPVLEVRALCPLIPSPCHTWALCGRPVAGLALSRNLYSKESASEIPHM